jgi:hypothetical protein
MQTSQINISERALAEAWAKITIIKWKKKFASIKNGNIGTLLRSFKYTVLVSAQENVL